MIEPKAAEEFDTTPDTFRGGDIYRNWMVGGKPLGECTHEDLLAAAARHEALAQECSRKEAFYRRAAGEPQNPVSASPKPV